MTQTPHSSIDEKYLSMDLLRFITCGSVDDGKSTLIGRLLYDSKSIFEDQWQAIESHSQRTGQEQVNLAFLTDGLRAEREQGITIDVAYRYFSTPRRKFIIADTPGHIQYTRNMITGASTADLAVLLVDARNGIMEQTRRHAMIASMLQIKHVILCVNKMDLVGYDEQAFLNIVSEFDHFTARLNIPDIRYIPVNALGGDNVVEKSLHMPWYEGSTFLHTLETIHVASDHNHEDIRFPVQYVIRPQSKEFHDFRGYAGRVEGGILKPGDTVFHYPSNLKTKVKSIQSMDQSLDVAFPPMSVTLTLEDDIDISRGDLITGTERAPVESQDLDVMICWLLDKPLQLRGKYILRHMTGETKCMIQEVICKTDINTLEPVPGEHSIGLNDIGRIKIRCAKPLYFDAYKTNRKTGSIILVDEFLNTTIAAGMIN